MYDDRLEVHGTNPAAPLRRNALFVLGLEYPYTAGGISTSAPVVISHAHVSLATAGAPLCQFHVDPPEQSHRMLLL